MPCRLKIASSSSASTNLFFSRILATVSVPNGNRTGGFGLSTSFRMAFQTPPGSRDQNPEHEVVAVFNGAVFFPILIPENRKQFTHSSKATRKLFIRGTNTRTSVQHVSCAYPAISTDVPVTMHNF